MYRLAEKNPMWKNGGERKGNREGKEKGKEMGLHVIFQWEKKVEKWEGKKIKLFIKYDDDV